MTQHTSITQKVSTWEIDPGHSVVEFGARHMMISSVKGGFDGLTGTIRADEGAPEASQVEAVIDVSSLNTRSEHRDTHLLSADFLDVAQYPSITFRSKKVSYSDSEHFRLVGDLTIRDVTRQVALDVTFHGKMKSPWGDERSGFSAHTKLNRKDFGLTWNLALEAGGFMVGDELNINIEIEAVKKD